MHIRIYIKNLLIFIIVNISKLGIFTINENKLDISCSAIKILNSIIQAIENFSDK